MNKPKTYHSKGDEALRIIKGEQSIIIVPIEPQPDTVIDGVPLLTTGKDSIAPAAVGMEPIKSPLGQPGDTVHVKEAHIMLKMEDGNLICAYKSSCPDNIFDYNAANGDYFKIQVNKWRSPVTMPLEAVRAKPVIKTVQPKRVQDVTEDEAEQLVEDYSTPNADAGDYSTYYKHYGISEKEADGWPWLDTAKKSFMSYIVYRFGLQLWENNDYVWVYTLHDLKCKKCGGIGKPSQALLNTIVGYEDFGNDKGSVGTTLSRKGPAKIVDCMKCESCGHSWVYTVGGEK